MKCPYMYSHSPLVCMVGDDPYRPSPFEVSNYCIGATHKRCPLFIHALHNFLFGEKREKRISM